MEKKKNLGLSYTLKGLMIAGLSLVLLIPSCAVHGLVKERKRTRDEAVSKIDSKWSLPQTVGGPVLAIPFTRLVADSKNKEYTQDETINVVPDRLEVDCKLYPEERYYGIYKTIVYKSVVTIEGEFAAFDRNLLPRGVVAFGNPYVKIGVSDRRGISGDPVFEMNGRSYEIGIGSVTDNVLGELLVVDIRDQAVDDKLSFSMSFELKGSGSINFLPVGRTSIVNVEGDWADPGFVGNYSPEFNIADGGFKANWEVLRFNRNMADTWYDGVASNSNREYVYDTGMGVASDRGNSFGVNLVDTVDVYQQSERSVKYAIMFILLTFVVFFFVEVFTGKKIHPIQYVLVGVALVLFYSLLISFAERLGFGWAYLISGIATIGLITAYASSVFKSRKPTVTLAAILSALYVYLYVILQLEDVALLAGSVGLFVILAVIMYFSHKVSWYNGQDSIEE